MPRDAVQAARQVARVHLCKIAVSALISRPLLLAVALRVLGPGVAVVSPVVLIALRPGLLSGALVDPVVGIGLEFGPLPLALAGALAVVRGTKRLVGILRAGFVGLAAAGAVAGHRRVSMQIRTEAATDHRRRMITRAIRRSWERGRAITHGRPLPYRAASRWRPGTPWRTATDRPPTPCAPSRQLSAPPSPHPGRSCCGA